MPTARERRGKETEKERKGGGGEGGGGLLLFFKVDQKKPMVPTSCTCMHVHTHTHDLDNSATTIRHNKDGSQTHKSFLVHGLPERRGGGVLLQSQIRKIRWHVVHTHTHTHTHTHVTHM